MACMDGACIGWDDRERAAHKGKREKESLSNFKFASTSYFLCYYLYKTPEFLMNLTSVIWGHEARRVGKRRVEQMSKAELHRWMLHGWVMGEGGN